jgi:hypothetical protein
MVIKANLHGKILSSHLLMIENFFYECAGKRNKKRLRKVALKRFERAERIAPYLGMDVVELLHYASDSNILHGVIMPDDSIVLHPDGCFIEIGKRGQRYLKKMTVLPHNLRRFLKSLPLDVVH